MTPVTKKSVSDNVRDLTQKYMEHIAYESLGGTSGYCQIVFAT